MYAENTLSIWYGDLKKKALQCFSSELQNICDGVSSGGVKVQLILKRISPVGAVISTMRPETVKRLKQEVNSVKSC